MRSRTPALAALTLGLMAAACESGGTEADYTGVTLNMAFPVTLPITELHVDGVYEDETSAMPHGVVEVDPANAGTTWHREQLIMFLDAAATGRTVKIHVDGKDADGGIQATADARVTLELGYFVVATATLTTDVRCGNGLIEADEACDDGGRQEGDGCSASCDIESGFVCARAPSLCTSAGVTAVVDPAASCPGNGTDATPFCLMSRALEAPWADVLVLRAGDYEEAIRVERDVVVHAEDGARLISPDSPALVVSAGTVKVEGLAVRGISRFGGGVVVQGEDTDVSLAHMTVGPSSTVGVTVLDNALFALDDSRLTQNAGGGLALDTRHGYVVKNTFITENGDPGAAFGGVWIQQAPTNALLVNLTVAENQAADPAQGGLRCEAPGEVLNTIAWNNGEVSAAAAAACAYAYSDVGPLAADATLPAGSFSEDPDFTDDHHLEPGSPCLDRGDPESIDRGDAPSTDYDGDPRPQGPNIDVGADEAG